MEQDHEQIYFKVEPELKQKTKEYCVKNKITITKLITDFLRNLLEVPKRR